MADGTYETQAGGAEERIGFCQHCGRPLTRTTVHQVGKALFCGLCVQERAAMGPAEAAATDVADTVSGAAADAANAVSGAFGGGARNAGAWQSVPPGYSPVPPVVPVSPASASPGLAAVLGLIPGVGAMYNGQFAKGFIHLIVFAVLVSLADNVNGIFGLFVAGWEFFMAFEAYHTAKARRDGLPLPDAFGWNNIGERLGFGKNWPGVPVTTPGQVPGTPGAPWQASAAQTGTDWVGYVPPSGFADVPPAGTSVAGAPPAPEMPVPPPPAAGWSAPYAGTASVPYADVNAGAAVPLVPSTRRFPVGAAVLIGLGLLFLIGNLAPEFRLRGRWVVPLLLAALGVWVLARRIAWTGTGPLRSRRFGSLVCDLRAPVLLLTLALLFALQAGHVFTLGQTWPVMFIVFGGLLLLERTVGRQAYAPPVTLDSDPDAGAGTAAWTAPAANAKGGQ